MQLPLTFYEKQKTYFLYFSIPCSILNNFFRIFRNVVFDIHFFFIKNIRNKKNVFCAGSIFESLIPNMSSNFAIRKIQNGSFPK